MIRRLICRWFGHNRTRYAGFKDDWCLRCQRWIDIYGRTFE